MCNKTHDWKALDCTDVRTHRRVVCTIRCSSQATKKTCMSEWGKGGINCTFLLTCLHFFATHRGSYFTATAFSPPLSFTCLVERSTRMCEYVSVCLSVCLSVCVQASKTLKEGSSCCNCQRHSPTSNTIVSSSPPRF